MALLYLTCRISSRSDEPTLERAHGGHRRLITEGRWEALSAEVTQLEHRRRALHRRRPSRSDAAMRRRHLAAVLPADARR
jgi:hypothetical protein